MFQTYRNAELSYGQLLGDGIAVWGAVIQPLNCAWLHVHRSIREGQDIVSDCVFLPDAGALQKLLKQCDEDMWISSVRVVSPGHLNESGDYRMDRLIEIRRVPDQSFANSYIYILQDGKIYPEENKEKLERSEMVFSSKLHCRSN